MGVALNLLEILASFDDVKRAKLRPYVEQVRELGRQCTDELGLPPDGGLLIISLAVVDVDDKLHELEGLAGDELRALAMEARSEAVAEL